MDHMKRSMSALLIGGALSLVTAGAAYARNKVAQGPSSAGSFYWDYWDLNDGTRAFGKRFSERMKNKAERSMVQAGVYSGLIHSFRHHNAIERKG